MAKQFSRLSSESVQQQLNQIETLTEGDLNDLLERLEAEKTKIPVEDHPIIDWGISIARIRILKQEKRGKKMLQDLDCKYDNGYEHFLAVAQWGQGEKDEWLKKCRSDLYQILSETNNAANPSSAESKSKILGQYITRFCRETQIEDPKEVLTWCLTLVTDSLNGREKDIFRTCHEKATSGLNNALCEI